jgi:hypothetical protein
MERQAYPSDVSDDAWALVALYLPQWSQTPAGLESA